MLRSLAVAEIPDYALRPLRRSADSIVEMHKLLHLAIHGLSIISNQPRMAQRLIDLTIAAEQEVTEDLRNNLDRANKDAEFTDKEKNNDFPLLHSYSLVGEWAALEAGIEDALIGILCNEPQLLQNDEFSRVKIALAKYELLDKEERMRFLLTEVQRTKASVMAQGVNTFESILDVFDLSGEVIEEVRKGLWEMNNLRNVIVHRQSLADIRLVEACPSMKLKVGDRVLVSHEKYAYYTSAALEYLSVIVCRLATRYSAEPPRWASPELSEFGKRSSLTET